MNINRDGSVTTDLTGTTPVITADHHVDAWGSRQVTLTLGTTMLTQSGTKDMGDVLHVKVNGAVLRDLAAALTEAADEAERLYAEQGPRTPAGAHGG